MKRTGLVIDKGFLSHETGPFHPEKPERLQGIYEGLEPNLPSYQMVYASLATREDILRIHTPEYFDLLQSLKGRDAALDSDTPIAPLSVEIATLAVGGSINLVREIHEGRIDNGFALVRPPGHHAEPGRGMGFCLYNNIAIAAAYLRDELSYQRVLIVDFDLHHGNGTQKAFYEDNSILYFSIHQYPYYPGTGHWSETGSSNGEGHTINVPLSGHQKDRDYLYVFERILRPVTLEFKPEFILVSAGYDIYGLDPLGTMEVTEEGFAWMTAFLKQLAEECCQGKLAYFLEGGYHLEGLRDSVLATLEVLKNGPNNLPAVAEEILPSTKNSVEKVIDIHSNWWKSLLKQKR